MKALFLRTLKLSVALAAGASTHAIGFDTFGVGDSQFALGFVTVGNAGNPADTSGQPNPVGSVPYVYRMGAYEVSRDVITKANAAGGLGLTLDEMEQLPGGPRAEIPATGITWYEATKFVNWLNTSTGHAPAYNFSEGAFGLWSSSEAWQLGGENLYRHKDAFYFLPSEGEWYKAAYYDGATAVYYDYPTGSDTPPIAVAGGTASGTAVYRQPNDQGPADASNAGGLSPYGTMGQGGNVLEWMESDFNGSNDEPTGIRAYRGGDWTSSGSELTSSDRFTASPPDVYMNMGFRVASALQTPAPVSDGGSTWILFASSLLGCSIVRKLRDRA